MVNKVITGYTDAEVGELGRRFDVFHEVDSVGEPRIGRKPMFLSSWRICACMSLYRVFESSDMEHTSSEGKDTLNAALFSSLR